MKEITLNLHYKTGKTIVSGPFSPILIKQIGEVFGIKREEVILFTVADAKDYAAKLSTLLSSVLEDYSGKLTIEYIGSIRCLSEFIMKLEPLSEKNKLIKNISVSFA